MENRTNNNNGALQKPVNSGFDAASTTSDVIKGIDLRGKTAIVTGGYSGIGAETVKALVAAGAMVYVPARNVEKAKRTLAEVKAALGIYDENGDFRHEPYNGFKTLEEGAATTVWCATSPALANVGGIYCEDAEVASLDTDWKGWDPQNIIFTKGVTPEALDPNTAKSLWELSEQLTGIMFSVNDRASIYE
jgi:hypothetical protein